MPNTLKHSLFAVLLVLTIIGTFLGVQYLDSRPLLLSCISDNKEGSFSISIDERSEALIKLSGLGGNLHTLDSISDTQIRVSLYHEGKKVRISVDRLAGRFAAGYIGEDISLSGTCEKASTRF